MEIPYIINIETTKESNYFIVDENMFIPLWTRKKGIKVKAVVYGFSNSKYKLPSPSSVIESTYI